MPANLENSAVVTGQEKVSFHYNSKERQCQRMLKLLQTIALISHASKVMLKIFQAGFNSLWTVNFKMFKLDLEKADEPEIKLPTSIGSSRKQESAKKIYFCFRLCQSLWMCESQQTVENSSRDGNTRPPDLPPEKSVCRSRSKRTGHRTTN